MDLWILETILRSWIPMNSRSVKPSHRLARLIVRNVEITESGGICGYDAGKKIKGRKHHIGVETIGPMVDLMLHGSGLRDRDRAPDLFQAIGHSGHGLPISSPLAVMRTASQRVG